MIFFGTKSVVLEISLRQKIVTLMTNLTHAHETRLQTIHTNSHFNTGNELPQRGERTVTAVGEVPSSTQGRYKLESRGR